MTHFAMREVDTSELLHTGSCGLHILHISFKAGGNATDWKLRKTLKTHFKLLSGSQARTADYTEQAGMSNWPRDCRRLKGVSRQKFVDAKK